jgi:hypothetical protein
MVHDMWRHCNNQEVFCWQRKFVLDTDQSRDSEKLCRCNVGTAFLGGALPPLPSLRWVMRGQHMFRQLRRAAFVLCAVASSAPASWAACSQHTFDPCPGPRSGYGLEVDQKTGRTWLKEAKAPATDMSTLARLSAAAKNVPAGSLAKAAADQHTGAWTTQVKPDRKAAWAPLK